MKLFRKILIANRGEIALRIIRTAKSMNISTVAIYAGQEKNALYKASADEAYELAGNTLEETFLNIDQIISIAKKTGARAIHPGYGFLSENENFARACEEAGITFIGPWSDTIELMGNKINAREIARNAGIPVIKGYTGSARKLADTVNGITYPVLIKAAAGGGGKAMKIVHSPSLLKESLESTAREAMSYFGNDTVYLEHYIENPRHIEVQILGDNYGNIIHLNERECSLQRRYQKIIEESPSPSVNNEIRREITNSALSLANAIGYNNAGTIEFLMDMEGKFYFLEMNTRLQVEHPVTENVTGLDIVREQILIAAGRKLSYSQDQIKISGHSIECRIYAENPDKGFMPSPGNMTCYIEPHGKGIRIDSGYNCEATVSDSYDPMISKLITCGKDREQARKRMAEALGNYCIHGIHTNISYLLSLLHSREFIDNNFSTVYCEKNTGKILQEQEKLKKASEWEIPAIAALLSSLHRKTGKNQIWDNLGKWRISKKIDFCFDDEIVTALIRNHTSDYFLITLNNDEFEGKYSFLNNKITIETKGEQHLIFISEDTQGNFTITSKGFEYYFRRFDFLKKKSIFNHSDDISPSGSVELFSPMPGRVISVKKQAGDDVSKGEAVMVVESMKMENSILAPANGIIEIIKVKEGQLVDGSSALAHFKQHNTAKTDFMSLPLLNK